MLSVDFAIVAVIFVLLGFAAMVWGGVCHNDDISLAGVLLWIPAFFAWAGSLACLSCGR